MSEGGIVDREVTLSHVNPCQSPSPCHDMENRLDVIDMEIPCQLRPDKGDIETLGMVDMSDMENCDWHQECQTMAGLEEASSAI